MVLWRVGTTTSEGKGRHLRNSDTSHVSRPAHLVCLKAAIIFLTCFAARALESGPHDA